MVPEGLVLPRLDLTRVLELTLDLELFGLERGEEEKGGGERRRGQRG